MRVRLKGINSKRKTLADGTVKTYYWLGKAGPRIQGEPGTLEFMASYNEAAARVRKPRQGVIHSVLHGFQNSDDFLSREPRTRADYVKKIKVIEAEFGDFPLTALADRRTRGEFMAWRDKLALRSRRQADYAWQVLARVLSWAMDRGIVAETPAPRRTALPRLTCGQSMDPRRRGGLPQERPFTPAPCAPSGPLDRAAAGRPPRPNLDAVRRQVHPAEAVEDRGARRHPGRSAVKGCLGGRKAGAGERPHLAQLGRRAVDLRRIPLVLAESVRRRWNSSASPSTIFVEQRSHGALAEASGPRCHHPGHPALAESGIRKLQRGTKVPDRAPDCA